MSTSFGRAMERSSGNHFNSSVVGQLQNDIVVDEMQRSIQRTDRHLSGPIQLNFIQGQGSFTGHRLPGGPVVLVADEGCDDPVLVDLTNVGTVGDEHFAVNPNSNS